MARALDMEAKGSSYTLESQLRSAARCFTRALAFLPVTDTVASFLQQPSSEGRLLGLQLVLGLQARMASHFAQVLAVQGESNDSVAKFKEAVKAAELHLDLRSGTSIADNAARTRAAFPTIGDEHAPITVAEAEGIDMVLLPAMAVGKLLSAVCEGMVEVAMYEDLLQWVPRLNARDAAAASGIVDMVFEERQRLKDTGNDLFREGSVGCASVSCWLQVRVLGAHSQLLCPCTLLQETTLPP